MLPIPGRLAGRLEHAHRDDLEHATRVAHLGRIPPVQQEGGPGRPAVQPQGQRADGQVGRAAAQVAAAGSGAVAAVLDRFAPWLDALAPKVIQPVSISRSEPASVPPPRRRVSGADARP